MYTQRPTALLALLCLCMAVSVSGLTASLVSQREDAQQALSETIDQASQTYRERTSASAMKSFHEKVLKEMRDRLAVVGKSKRAARFDLAYAKRQLKNLEGSDMERAETARRSAMRGIGDSEDRINMLLREKFLRSPVEENSSPWIKGLLTSTQGGMMDDGTRDTLLRAYDRTWNHFVTDVTDRTVDVLRVQAAIADTKEGMKDKEMALDTLRSSYLEDLKTAERAENGLILSDKELARAKVEAAEVHHTVLRMQADLAKIDAQLRDKSEQSLFEMGLLSAAPEEQPTEAPVSASFMWPVYGPIAATFHDPLYRQFFGIPHNGVDIMTAQSTQVHAAADGIVFLVKDGGETGYTYILIGHRDGYATLYGHISVPQVAPGIQVKKGDVIGLSGGTPGTPGAGPTTTGPHLHFEVILNGSNIDPFDVLPNSAT